MFLILLIAILPVFASSTEGDGDTRSCVDLMRRGHCDYYKCFNELHSCPGDYDFGFEYCDRLEHHKEHMTDEALRWLNGSRLCAMEQMREIVDQDCETIKRELKSIHKSCEVEAGLCGNILWTNWHAFMDVGEMRTGTVYYLHSLRGCPVDMIRSFVYWVKENTLGNAQLREWAKNAKSELQQFVGRLRDFFN